MVKGRKALSVAGRIRRERVRENLNNLLRKRHMTQEELSRKTNIPSGTISNYRKVTGIASLPSKKNLLAMANALHCEPDEIDPAYLQIVKVSDTLDNKENVDIFAQNLQTLITNEGLAYNEFCDKIGISYRTLWSWFTGAAKPSDESLEKLAKYFKMPVKKLVTAKLNSDDAFAAPFRIARHLPLNLSKRDEEKIIDYIEYIKYKNKNHNSTD